MGKQKKRLKVNDKVLDCSQEDPSAGPYGCFFQPISTCSLADATPDEILSFSSNSFNESARLMLGEIRKGVSAYHPPFGLFDYIWSIRKSFYRSNYEFGGFESSLWASAIAAYTFRLKPSLVDSFAPLKHKIFDNEEAVWGMHVRHGDLRALSNVYSYKEIFEFEEFFAAAQQLSHRRKETPSKLFVATDSAKAEKIPVLFDRFSVAQEKDAKKTEHSQRKTARSDDDNEEEDDDEEEDDNDEEDDDNDEEDDDNDEEDDDEDEEDDEEDEEEDDEDDDEEDDDDDDEDDAMLRGSWFSPSCPASSSLSCSPTVPRIITVNNTERYRTQHGSHTVAANGGCMKDSNYDQKGMRCALHYEDIIMYQSMDEHRSVPRSYRLMRVLLESIEDIYLLSQCEVLIGTGSSHFSTLASLLVLARTGSKFANSILFLDQATIDTGVIPTAFLHGMNLLNGTHGIVGDDGSERWNMHYKSFITALPLVSSYRTANEVRLDFDLWSRENAMTIRQGLPHVPEKVFYLEAMTWLGYGTGSHGNKYKPTMPGHCPGRIKNIMDTELIAVTINLGVEHLERSHNGQALQCWSDAIVALQALQAKKKANPKAFAIPGKLNLEEMLDIAVGNAKSLRSMRYIDYVVNENKDTGEFLEYSTKYNNPEYEDFLKSQGRSSEGGGVFPPGMGLGDEVAGSRRGGGRQSSSSLADKLAAEDAQYEANGLLSLDDILDRIAKLEKLLGELKKSRDLMLELSSSMKFRA
jgi:hypothetical protein